MVLEGREHDAVLETRQRARAEALPLVATAWHAACPALGLQQLLTEWRHAEYFIKCSEPFPPECSPEGLRADGKGFCPTCQENTNWAAGKAQQAVVLGLGTIHDTSMRTYSCCACQHSFDVDGYGYAVLRKEIGRAHV